MTAHSRREYQTTLGTPSSNSMTMTPVETALEKPLSSRTVDNPLMTYLRVLMMGLTWS